MQVAETGLLPVLAIKTAHAARVVICDGVRKVRKRFRGEGNPPRKTHSSSSQMSVRKINPAAVQYAYFLSCRPLSIIEKRNGSRIVVQCNKGELQVKLGVGKKATTKTFTFDKVYGPESRQMDVFRGVVEPMIEEVLMGYNCTVFA